MDTHSKNAFEIFKILNSHEIVKDIKYLPDEKNTNNRLWKKYHKINNGLITFSLKKKGKIENFLNALNFFKIGFSWGGYESLILPLKKFKSFKKSNDK